MNDKSLQQTFDLLENVIFLKKTALFSAVKTSELRAVAAIAEVCTIVKGTVFVKENEAGDCLYIIKQGLVKITKAGLHNTVIELAEIGSGECVGEMALFDDESRSASAMAHTDCIVMKVTRDDLIDVMVEYPMIAVEMMRIFVKRLRASNAKVEVLTSQQTGLSGTSPGTMNG